MRILIGIIGNDAARFHLFTASVMKLDTVGLDVDKEMLIGGDWCGARNELAQMTLDGDYTHLWFMDDDHAFAPDLLKRLAAHNVPLITPLCLARVAPFPLVTYAKTEDGTSHLPVDLTGVPGEGLLELEAAGCAGMLIRRDVLEGVREDTRAGMHAQATPWFEYGDRSEDIIFCEKAKAAGFKLYADLGARLGHITTTVVYPDINDGQWMTRLKIGGGLDLFVSSAQDWQAVEEEEDPPSEPAPVDRSLFPPETEPLDPAQVIAEADFTGMMSTDFPGQPFGPGDTITVGPALVQDPCGICGAQSTWTSMGRQGCADHSPIHPDWGAERIEIWVDETLRWWWRALNYDGKIIAKDSAIREEAVITQAQTAFPGTDVHLIQRETDDSRTPKKYGPPARLWDRGS